MARPEYCDDGQYVRTRIGRSGASRPEGAVGEHTAQKSIVTMADCAAGANWAPSWDVGRWFLNERFGAPERNRKQVVASWTLEEDYTMGRQGLAGIRRSFYESAFILITDYGQ